MGKGPRPSSHSTAGPQSPSVKTSLVKRRHILRSCPKHRDHCQFYRIKCLGLEHIPPDVSNAGEILKTVRHLARFVVRVRVRKVSSLHAGIEGRSSRGRCSAAGARTCTGLATSVGKDYVSVIVPAHAVRDNIEALHTTAEFFYDDSDDDSGAITVRGLSLRRHSQDRTAQLTCRACPRLAHRFRSQETPTMATTTLAEAVNLDYAKENSGGGVVVLISHPHGFSKRVTLGSVDGWDVVGRDSGESGNLSAVADSTPESEMLESSPLLGASVPPEPLPVPSASAKSYKQWTPSLSQSAASSSSCCLSSEGSGASSSSSSKLPGQNAPTLTPRRSEARIVTVGPTEVQSSGMASFCRTFMEKMTGLCRRMLCLPPSLPNLSVRLSHSAHSCPGSSGGAVLLIGRSVWAQLQQVTSLPVATVPLFVHVGVVGEGKVGVAVPVELDGSSLCMLCG